MYVVVDTNVVGYLFRGVQHGAWYREYLNDQTPCIAFQTLAEVLRWPEVAGWGKKRRGELATYLHQYLVLPYDSVVTQEWAYINAERQRQGHEISCQDAWIAACAVGFQLPLVTHNAADFAGISRLQVVTAPPF